MAVRKVGSRARLFAALLAAAGYSGRLAMVRPASEDRTESPVPSLALLDRIAVHVEGDDWVSLEQKGAPYGYLPPDLRVRPARYIDDGAETATDGGAVPTDVQRVVLELALEDDGSARGVITEELTGVLAAGWRSDLQEIPGAEIEKRFEESYLGEVIAGAALKSLRLEGLDDPEAPLRITYEIEIPRLGSRADRGLNVIVPFPITLLKRIGGLAERITPIVIQSRIEKTVNAAIELPPGFSLRARESGGSIESEWGRARRVVRLEDRIVEAEYRAQLAADRVEPDEYADFMVFARELDRLTRLEFEVVPKKIQQ
jgi:hypothetical protein